MTKKGGFGSTPECTSAQCGFSIQDLHHTQTIKLKYQKLGLRGVWVPHLVVGFGCTGVNRMDLDLATDPN